MAELSQMVPEPESNTSVEAQNTNCLSNPADMVSGDQDGPKQLVVDGSEDALSKGGESCKNVPPTPTQSSLVSYPFGFIKPCAAYGETTLQDINEKILGPLRRDRNDPFSTSTFSGKTVVKKTKVQTEGGEGSVTVLRTKGMTMLN